MIVLPNNSNVILSAEQAAEHSPKPVRVVPTRSIPAGIAAMVVYDASASADDNAAEMEEAVAAVATGAVTTASRDVQLDGLAVEKGAFLGLLEGEPVAGGGDFERGRGRRRRAPARRASRSADGPDRRGRARAERRSSAALRSSIRTSRSRSRTAASRTTTCCSRPSDGDPGRARRGQRRLPQRPGGAATLGGEIEVVASEADGEASSSAAPSSRPTCSRRLPAARARRRPGDQARPRALPGRRGRRADRGGGGT